MEKIKLFTSYFAKWNEFSEDEFIKLSISRTHPALKNIDKGDLRDIFAPSQYLLNKVKSGEINQGEYKVQYLNEVKNRITPAQVKELIEKLCNSKKLTKVVFFCYEAPDKPCHRHYLAELIETTLEVPVKEFDFNKD